MLQNNFIKENITSLEVIKKKTNPNLSFLGSCSRCHYVSSQPVCKACILLEGLNKGIPRWEREFRHFNLGLDIYIKFEMCPDHKEDWQILFSLFTRLGIGKQHKERRKVSQELRSLFCF